MNLQERAFSGVTAAPARTRRRWVLAVILGGLLVVGGGFAAYRYFIYCGDCRPSPIICPDPCTLPTFS
jgi:hypothetical protein